MGGFKLTGLGAGTTAGDSLSYDQLAANSTAGIIGANDGASGAIYTTVQGFINYVLKWFGPRTVSILNYGGTPGLSFDNTAAFNACLTALGSRGGIVKFSGDNFRGNFVVNNPGITLQGTGGVGELTGTTCLRPYATGAGTTTLMLSNQTQNNQKLMLDQIVVSGDDGAGNMAAKTLWINGGCVDCNFRDVDLMAGVHTLHIEPGGGFPASGLNFSQLKIRNDLNDVNSRAIYIRKYADVTGYVTAVYFHQFHINKTGAGKWLEVDGTGSTGLVVNFGQGYVDTGINMGILTSASGLETIECDGGLQLDPGVAGDVIMLRQDNVKDPTRYLRGHIQGVGGQKIQFADATQLTLPIEPGLIMYQPRLRQAFLGEQSYFQPDFNAPYSTTIYFDFQSLIGPMRWFGTAHRFMDTTEATSTTLAALQTEGGIACKKRLQVGGDIYTWGGNGAASGLIGSVTGGGGLFLSALGTNQNVRLDPTGTGIVDMHGPAKVASYTVATLPAAAAGTKAFVTDATVTTFASVVTGGGGNGVPVYSDGTNWRIG
jgi:hypothetical protein